MQLYTCLNYINQALNYPAITYEDVSNFFDMAIADLNTSLHTDIPLISTMITKYGQYLSNELTNKVVLTNLTVDTTIPVYVSEAAATTAGATYYYNSTTGDYGLYNGTSFEYFPIIYGVLQINNNSQLEYYKSYKVSAYSDPVWAAHVLGSANFDLELYFPDEWVLLWLIPYICFKYTLRDGGTASSFAEEISQGYTQLQDTYDIPSTVLLTTYADKYAYREDVEKNLPNLNIQVPTKAIYKEMIHPRNVQATFGSMYDRGGF